MLRNFMNRNQIHVRVFSSRLKRERPPPISVTSRAADRLAEMLQDKEGEKGIIIGVKRRGCNGLSYTMNYAAPQDFKEAHKYEVVDLAKQGIKLLVDQKALFSIVGTEMDFDETELSSEFTFNNPNAKGSCGCGESFSV